MPNRDLDRLDLNMLAIHCRRVFESHGVHPGIAEEALSLTREWSSLTSTPNSEAGTTEALRERMLGFLTRIRDV